MNLRRGFTLVEMAIVLFIISLLILIILPNLNGQRDRAQSIHRNAMQTVVQGQLTAYLDDHAGHTKTVSYDDLVTGKYLTKAQVKQAQSEHLTIKGDTIVDQ